MGKVRKSSARTTSVGVPLSASSACRWSSRTSSSSLSFCRLTGLYLWLKWYSTRRRTSQERATAAAMLGVLCPCSTARSWWPLARVASWTKMSASRHAFSPPSPSSELQSPRMHTFRPGMGGSRTSLGFTTCPFSSVTVSPFLSCPYNGPGFSPCFWERERGGGGG